MLSALYKSVVATLSLGLILCGVYPLVVYLAGNFLFHKNATGGIIESHGQIIGSKLIGQNFYSPSYFHGRPSSAGEKGYDASSSSGSNLGPTNQKLYDNIKANVDNFLKENPSVKRGDVPTDIVTSSGSGLDPHISKEAAIAQSVRVAESRHMSQEQIRNFIRERIEGPQLGFLGEPVMNVLSANLDLDKNFPIQ